MATIRQVQLAELKATLATRGLSEDVRKKIRNAKIAIVDDRVEDLHSFIEGLQREGFTNLVEITSVESVNALLDQDFDLIVLDLVGVATDSSIQDGVGVLAAIKRTDPALPILVVSGNTVTPDVSADLSKADLIRTKPILPIELASDVEMLLRARYDAYWGAFAILHEVRRLTPELQDKLSWSERIRLWYYCHRLAADIRDRRPDVIERIVKVTSIASRLGLVAVRITRLSAMFT